MTQNWEWTINGMLILATLLNLYQAYDWWKTTQKLKDAIENAEHHRKRYIQLADAYQDFIEHLQKKTGVARDEGH
jgi:hypothetical protein